MVAHPSSANAAGAASPEEAITRFGVTADSPVNTWSAGKPLDEFARQFWGKRLDYVLYRQPVRPPTSDRAYPVLKCKDCKVVLTDKVPGHPFSYSDHFGLESTLEIRYPDESEPPTVYIPTELSSASIATTIQALTACYRFSRERARKELTIFGVSLFLLVPMAVGAAWLPFGWIGTIFIVMAVALAWLATTMLYEGFLYGNWECNALMNVTEELEIYKTGLEILSGVQRSP